jgi:predicted DNA-binding protein (UPF0251 family)
MLLAQDHEALHRLLVQTNKLRIPGPAKEPIAVEKYVALSIREVHIMRLQEGEERASHGP